MTRPIILFLSLDHARAAVAAAAELNIPITLQSAPGAAAHAGIGFLKAVPMKRGLSTPSSIAAPTLAPPWRP